MKTILITALICAMASVITFAQAPQAFKYQAVIRDTTGNVYQEKLISLKISILQGEISGEEVYGEIHDVWTDKLGLVNLNIGQGFVYYGNLSEIPWGEDIYFLRLMIDLDSAMDYKLLGTSQLMSVPYALYAESSGNNPWNKAENGIYYTDGKVGFGIKEPSSMLDIEYPAQTGGGNDLEVLIEGRISDSPDDFFRIYNGTGNDQQFIPSIWGHHQSDNRVAFGLMGTISQDNDIGDWPVTIFTSRTYNGEGGFANVQNRPLFSWRGVYDSKMTMLANGFLGIGTANPNTLLHIEGASDLYNGRDFLIIKNNTTDEVSTAALKIRSGASLSSTVVQHNADSYLWEGRSDLGILWNDGQGIAIAATNDTGSIRFETGGAGLEKERMRITENGKVAIGTTDPLHYKLFISTTAHGGAERGVVAIRNNSDSESSICNMYISSGDGGSTYLNFTGQNYIHWGGRYKSHTMLGNNGKGVVFRTGQFDGQDHQGRYAFEFYRNLGNTYTYDEKVSITYEGNMGIGIISPQRKLHVNDVMRLEPRYSSPQNPSEGDIYMDGNEHVLKVFDGTEWKRCW